MCPYAPACERFIGAIGQTEMLRNSSHLLTGRTGEGNDSMTLHPAEGHNAMT